MPPQSSHHPSYGAGDHHYSQMRAHVRSSFSIIPHAPKPLGAASFLFGRSDSRLRPLLNQEERNRLHCWAMIVTLASSTIGIFILLAAFLH